MPTSLPEGRVDYGDCATFCCTEIVFSGPCALSWETSSLNAAVSLPRSLVMTCASRAPRKRAT